MKRAACLLACSLPPISHPHHLWPGQHWHIQRKGQATSIVTKIGINHYMIVVIWMYIHAHSSDIQGHGSCTPVLGGWRAVLYVCVCAHVSRHHVMSLDRMTYGTSLRKMKAEPEPTHSQSRTAQTLTTAQPALLDQGSQS